MDWYDLICVAGIVWIIFMVVCVILRLIADRQDRKNEIHEGDIITMELTGADAREYKLLAERIELNKQKIQIYQKEITSLEGELEDESNEEKQLQMKGHIIDLNLKINDLKQDNDKLAERETALKWRGTPKAIKRKQS